MASKLHRMKSKQNTKNQSNLNSSARTEVTQIVAQELHRQLASVEQRITKSEFRSGPHPTPADAKAYQELLPDFMERSVRIAEIEQEQGHAHIRRGQWMEFVDSIIAKLIGFIVIICLIGFGIYMIEKGNNAAGIASIVCGALFPVASRLIVSLSGDRQSDNTGEGTQK